MRISSSRAHNRAGSSSKRQPAAAATCTSSKPSENQGGRVRQRILQPLGREDILKQSGALDRLLQSLGRHCERSIILSDIAAGTIACRRIGAPLLFGRLWQRVGIADVLHNRLAGRGFEFDVERAIFVTVLHRIMVSGSDRACERWM